MKMVGSSPMLVAAAIPLLVLALSLSNIRPVSAGEIVIKNSLKPPFVIGVECPPLNARKGEIPRYGTAVVVQPGSTATLALPAGVGGGTASVPSSGYACVGSWEEVDGVVRFTAYSYARDHGRCGGRGGKGKCAVDVRPDGVYAWDNTTKGWVQVQEFAYRPLGSSGGN